MADAAGLETDRRPPVAVLSAPAGVRLPVHSRARTGDEAPDLVRLALGAFLLVVLVRVAIFARTALIGADSPRFLVQARLFLEGRPFEAVAQEYHPLYPFLVSLAGRFIHDLETAGVLVSIAMSAAALVPLLALAAWLGGRTAAAATALLFAVSPYLAQHGAEIMSEATYVALLLGAAALGHLGAARLRIGWLVLAGALTGLAYLARPEGAGALLVIAFFTLLPGERHVISPGVAAGAWSRARAALRDTTRRGLAVLAAVLAFVAVAAPYMDAIGWSEGPAFTKKKRLGSLVGLEAIARSMGGEEDGSPEPLATDAVSLDPRLRPGMRVAGSADAAAPPADAVYTRTLDHGTPPARGEVPLSRHLLALWTVLKNFGRAFPAPFLIFLLAGLVLRARPRATRLELYLLALVAFYVLVLYRVHLVTGYATRRHLLPLVALSLPIAGLGLVALRDRLVALVPRLRPQTALVALVAAALAVSLPFTLKAQRATAIAERRAGEWIAADAARQGLPAPLVIVTHREKVAYYAGATWHEPALRGYEPVLAAARRAGAPYLALRSGRVEKYWPGFEAGIRPEDLALVHEERDDRGRILIYRVLPAR